MNKDEDYGFDVAGYLHIPQLLSADEIEACNRAIDAVGREDGMLDWPEPWCDPFRALQEHLGGLYLLPKPHCAPFHRMIAHPAITQRLNWMLGYGHSETGEPMCCEYPQGTTGGSLHGQNTAGFYRLEGRSMVEKVNVAWALHDEAPAD